MFSYLPKIASNFPPLHGISSLCSTIRKHLLLISIRHSRSTWGEVVQSNPFKSKCGDWNRSFFFRIKSVFKWLTIDVLDDQLLSSSFPFFFFLPHQILWHAVEWRKEIRILRAFVLVHWNVAKIKTNEKTEKKKRTKIPFSFISFRVFLFSVWNAN